MNFVQKVLGPIRVKNFWIIFGLQLCAGYVCFCILPKHTRAWCNWCSMAEFSSACTGSSPVARYLHITNTLDMIVGILLILWGIALIAFSAPLSDTVGRREWADRHLGWTTKWFVLIGFASIVLGWFALFGGNLKPDAPQAFPTTQSLQPSK